ncbi:MAG: TraR/DksA C4-type zinc finger protein [Candidatus Rokubacteria bacterium]|nr:TraR/DksA C4-type zinc finger protein [Candidatus Rokubacteria bacterium]
MDELRDRIQKELESVADRLRQLGGAVVIEEFPGAVGDNSPFADPTEEVQVQGEREISFATRSLLVERANRLAEALERLKEGEYGICEECGEAIAPARLKAMPEVTTCVRCQDRLERSARRLEPAGVLFGDLEEED